MGWDEKCAALRTLVDQFQLQLNDIVPSVPLRHVSRTRPANAERFGDCGK
jgi:hypothetical protein